MIAIIDYGIGNLHSVLNAFKTIGYDACVTSDKNVILSADKVVLPGVGAFGDAMDTFKERGFVPIIEEIIKKGTPLLGICVGMQMLFDESEEYGIHKGLGLLKGRIIKFNDKNLKIPQIGWNNLDITKDNPLLKGIKNGSYVYFVHSYRLADASDDEIIAYAEYGIKYGCAVNKGNVYGVQFHPEKSGDVGLQILKNFGEL